jgi:hypothetical protein
MQTDTRLGTFEEVIANANDNIKAIAVALRDLVIKLDADTYEVPRPGEKAASYGVGPKKMSEAYVYIMPLKDSVNLGFFHGANLEDPKGLLEGTGAKMRHVKIRLLTDVKSAEITALIRDAIRERKTALKL